MKYLRSSQTTTNLQSVARSPNDSLDLTSSHNIHSILPNMAVSTSVNTPKHPRRSNDRVNHTRPAQRSLASSIVRNWRVHSSRVVGHNRSLHIVENIPLNKRIRILALKRMSINIVPVVVRHVHNRGTTQFRSATPDVVDVVVFEGYCVELASHEERPVVVRVAAGGPRGCAVDKGIGDCHAGVLCVAGYDVLAADEGGGDVADPDV